MNTVTPALTRDAMVIGLVGVAHFFSHFVIIAVAPLFPLMRDTFDVSYAALGLILTVMFLTSGLFQAFSGILVDRLGGRTVLIGGMGLLGASILLMGLAPSYAALLPLAAIAGIGNSVFHPADLAILTEKVGRTRIGRAYAVHGIAGTLGFTASPVVLGLIASLASWRVALVACGIATLIGALTLALAGDSLRSPAPGLKESGGANAASVTFAGLVSQPPVLAAFGFFVLMAMASIGTQSFAVTGFVQLHDVALAAATTALTLYFVGQLGGNMVGGVLADRTTRHDAVTVGGLCIGAGCMALVASGAFPFPAEIALLILAGFCMGAMQPSRDMLVRAVAPKGSAGRVFGFVYSGLDLGSAVAPVAMGWLLDQHAARVAFASVAALLLFTAATVLVLRRAHARAA